MIMVNDLALYILGGEYTLTLQKKGRQVCFQTFTIANYIIGCGQHAISPEVAFGFCLETE